MEETDQKKKDKSKGSGRETCVPAWKKLTGRWSGAGKSKDTDSGNDTYTAKKRSGNQSREKALKKNTLLKVSRAALWTMLVFFFVKGLFYTFRPDTVTEAQQLIHQFQTDLEQEKKLNQEISAFAQNFVKQYLTYTAREDKEYQERIGAYMGSTGSIPGVELIEGKSEAVYAAAYRMEQYGADQWDVYVLAEVEYESSLTGQEGVSAKRAQTTLCVPVRVQTDGMVIEELPMLVNDNVLLTGYERQEYTGTAIPEKMLQDVGNAVTNFLKAYYEQDETVIDYYLSKDAQRSRFLGLKGRYLFDSLKSLKAYREEGQKEIICIVEVTVTDEVNQSKWPQRMNLSVEQGDDGKYYILDMDVRTGAIQP